MLPLCVCKQPHLVQYTCISDNVYRAHKVIAAADELLNIIPECKNANGYFINNFRICFSLRENRNHFLSLVHNMSKEFEDIQLNSKDEFSSYIALKTEVCL